MNTTTNTRTELSTSRRMFRAAAVITVGLAATTVLLINPASARQGRGSDNTNVTSNSTVSSNVGQARSGTNDALSAHDANDDWGGHSSSNTANTTNSTASSTPSSSVKPAVVAPATPNPVVAAPTNRGRGRGRGRGGRA
jgi:hypothetical protein